MLDRSQVLHSALTLITIGNSSFTCLVSLIVLIKCIYHLFLKRVSQDDKIVILHSSNLYFFIMMSTILLTIFHTQTIIGDLYGSHFQSKRCIFLGNLLIVANSNIYMASVSKVQTR